MTPRRTPFAGFEHLDAGDSLASDGYAFQSQNPDIADLLAKIGAVLHRHDAHAAMANPTLAPTLSVAATGGSIPSATTIYVEYTLIDGQAGESLPTSVQYVTSPSGYADPAGAPTATVSTSAGSMLASTPMYAVSVTDGVGGETALGPPVSVTVPPATNAEVVLSGLTAITNTSSGSATAAGWRLWRSVDGGNEWDLMSTGLHSVDSWTDNGTSSGDCSVSPLSEGTTGDTGVLSVTVPTGQPSAATNFNIYACTDGAFTSPCLLGTYPIADAGVVQTFTAISTQTGAPPAVSQCYPGANKIDPNTDILNWTWKLPVATVGALPTSGNTDGDARVVLSDYSLHIWDAGTSSWTSLSGGSSGVSSFNTRTGSVTAASGDYTAAQVTNAGDKASASQQAFTGEVASPDFKTTGLTGATATARFVGGTTSGAPASGTFALGDFIIDQSGKIWICIGAGSPGTWTQVSGGGGAVSSVFGRTGAVSSQPGDYTASEVTNAADKSSSSQQAFTGEVKAPDFAIAGLTGATAAGRYVGTTTSGAPVAGTFSKGDWVTDQAGIRWTCTTAGSPGTWTQEPGSGTGGGGVSSFNSRTGAVAPGNADYLAVSSGGLTGATASSRYVGGTTAGAPTTGTFLAGDWITDQAGKRWTCTVAGTPGIWTQEPGTGGAGSSTAARAYRSTALTLTANTWNKIPLDTTSFDPGGSFDVATNHRFNVATTGKYLVIANAETAQATWTAIYKNGVALPSYGTDAAATSGASVSLAVDIVDCTAGDYLELWVNPSTATALSVGNGAGNNFLSITPLSTGTSTLAGDTDVTISSALAGQGLVYDSSAGKWKNGMPSHEAVNTVAASSTAQTIPDPWSSPFQTISDITLTAACTLTFPTAAAGKSFTAILRQDATGGRVVTFPTVTWLGGGVQASKAASAVDVATFMCTDGTHWIGTYSPQQVTTTWTNISSFTNGWTNFGSGYVPARYRLDALGFVHLEGLCKPGTNNTAAFTLPAGFRPGFTLLLGALSGGPGAGTITISTAGIVTLNLLSVADGDISFSVVFLAEN